MNTHENSLRRAKRRENRVRARVRGTAEKPRFSVYRSSRHLAAQVIDDEKRVTLCALSTAAIEAKGTKAERGRALGAAIAERMKELGILAVVFDRGRYRYHGRVRQVADALREGGITV